MKRALSSKLSNEEAQGSHHLDEASVRKHLKYLVNMDGSDAGSSNPAPDAKIAEEIVEPVGISEIALREDQIQNAVAFLTHPKVRGSAVSAKRSFLEKKGLTAAEIDEAFKRVPEPPATPAATLSTSSTPTYGANNLVTYTQQPSGAAQLPSATVGPQTVAAAPGAGTVMLHPQQQMQAMQPVQQPLRWTQVVLGVGVAAAGAYGLHQLIFPRITSWAAHFKASRAAAAEAEAQRTAALTAALESLAAGQTKLQETLEGLQAAIDKQQQQQLQQQQQQQHEERYRPVDEPRRVGYPSDTAVRSSHSEYLRCQSPGLAAAQQRQQYYMGGSSGPSSYDASRAAAIRGWDPYDSSRSPAAAVTPAYSSTAAGGGLNGYGMPTDAFEVVPRNAAPADTFGTAAAAAAGKGVPPQQQQQQSAAGTRPDEAPHSAAFHEVMEMVRAGITPPNVRTDIQDSPPDPTRPISEPQLQPRGKPWERNSASSNAPPLPAAAAAAKTVFDTPTATVADNFMQQQDGFSTWPGVQQQQGMAAAGNAVAAEMEQAAAVRRKSNELAAGYNMSHLLGSDSSRHDAPWRPPPPPAPTVAAVRPNSSGSSSSKTAAVPAPAAAAAAAGQGVTGSDQPGSHHGVAADGGDTDQVVADVAADVVRNVVQAAQQTQAAAVGQVEEISAA